MFQMSVFKKTEIKRYATNGIVVKRNQLSPMHITKCINDFFCNKKNISGIFKTVDFQIISSFQVIIDENSTAKEVSLMFP